MITVNKPNTFSDCQINITSEAIRGRYRQYQDQQGVHEVVKHGRQHGLKAFVCF